MRLGRICPEISADLVFAPLEWKPSYALLDKKIPTLNAALRILAILRGFWGENQTAIRVLKVSGSVFKEFRIVFTEFT